MTCAGHPLERHPFLGVIDSAGELLCEFLLQYRLPFASGFVTHTLAHMLDSLVRVSRRVGLRRFTERARFMVSGAAAHRYELRQTTFHVLREGHRNKTDHNSLIRLL